MIHLLMAIVDYEVRDPVRAFTTLEAANAFLAIVHAHYRKRPSVFDDDPGDWESRNRDWAERHPATGHAFASRFDIESVPLDDA